MKLKAIVVGNLVDVAGTMLASLMIGLLSIAAEKVFLQGTTFGRLSLYLGDGEMRKPLMLVVGCFFTILGGYVSARIAKVRELLYGGLSTLLCLSIGILGMLGKFDISHIGLEVLTILLGLLGGYLGLRINGKKLFQSAQ